MYNTKRQTSSKILHFSGKKYGHNCLFLRKNKKVVQTETTFLKILFFSLYLDKISSNFLLASSIEQLL